MPVDDEDARRRLGELAACGVAAGVWAHAMQRPPHLVPQLRSQPWWDPGEFDFCAVLERAYPAIREEVQHSLSSPCRRPALAA